jgi:hypothetical protein
MDFWQISNIIGLAMSFVAMLLSIRGIMLCNKQIKDGEARIKRFDKSFFEKGEDVVIPGAPPDDTIIYNRESKAPGFAVYTSKVMYGDIDPTKVSLMDFCTGVELRKESVPYIANSDNFQPGTTENEAEILHDVDTEIKRKIKKRVTENSTTVETREGAPPLPPITQPIVQFRDGVPPTPTPFKKPSGEKRY